MKFAIIVIVLIAGCSTVRSVRDANTGEMTYSVDCSGPAPTTWGTCYARAEKICAQGFNTLTTTYQANPPVVSIGSHRVITIRCKH